MEKKQESSANLVTLHGVKVSRPVMKALRLLAKDSEMGERFAAEYAAQLIEVSLIGILKRRYRTTLGEL